MDIGRALIVDDSKVVQFKLKRMLEARGWASTPPRPGTRRSTS